MNSKFISLLLLMSLIFFTCQKEEVKPLRAFEPEIFVLPLGEDGWEITCTVKLEGFIEKKIDDKFNVDIELLIDIISPISDTLKAIASSTLNETVSEKHFPYLNLEATANLPLSYEEGAYKAIFHIWDKNQSKKINILKEFIIKE
ncbi:MAG: hypothetical protein N3A61_05335 [Ignavibacteria bacterium]|nr:hypothetical protein [Ignavibacteria bacterium]